jgi:diguanylate cyclase (GGDEF)-like protein
MFASVYKRLEFGRSAIIRASIAGGLYFITAAVTIWATSNGRDHATVWPADAIILALLLDMKRKDWPLALFLGLVANHLANDVMRGFHMAHVLYGAINMGQVWVAATMLCKQSQVDSILADVRELGRFVFWAVFIAPGVGGLLGSVASHWIYEQDFWNSYLRWFASNSLGFFVATPFIKAMFDGSFRTCWTGKTIQQRLAMAGLLCFFAATVAGVFLQRSLPLLFVPVSVLTLMTFKLGRLGVKVAVVLAALIGAYASFHDLGPISLVAGGSYVKAIFFQFYLAVLLCTSLVIVSIVSSRVELMQRLADRETFLKTLLANSPEVVLSFDRHGSCTYAGGPTDVLLGMTVNDLLALKIDELALRIGQQIPTLEASPTEPTRVSPVIDFEPIGAPHLTIEAIMSPLWTNNQFAGSVLTFRDITERKMRERNFRKKAFVDELTQVYNRAGFYQIFEENVETGGVYSLALIDVDWFKLVNDNFGHAVGDRALMLVAQILQRNVRNNDIVGRLGGDEFAIVFQGSHEGALAACRRIAEEIRSTELEVHDGRVARLSISCGISAMKPDWTLQNLFDAADTALYAVKDQGRNGVLLAA